MELLGRCYEYLLQLILDRRARKLYDSISSNVAEQIYQGYWFDSATQSMLASVEPLTRLASGTISVALYKGNVAFHAASGVPHSLYSEETASMEDIGDFDHADSEGFLAVLGGWCTRVCHCWTIAGIVEKSQYVCYKITILCHDILKGVKL